VPTTVVDSREAGGRWPERRESSKAPGTKLERKQVTAESCSLRDESFAAGFPGGLTVALVVIEGALDHGPAAALGLLEGVAGVGFTCG
jgi:hypothetical protein